MHGIKHVALTSKTFVIAYYVVVYVMCIYVVYTTQYASLVML